MEVEYRDCKHDVFSFNRIAAARVQTPLAADSSHHTPAMLLRHSQLPASLQQSSRNAPQSRKCVAAVRAAAGGFGKSNKKKVDISSGGMAMPEKVFRNATLDDLRDDAPGKNKSKTEDGAPPGFPEGMICTLNASCLADVPA